MQLSFLLFKQIISMALMVLMGFSIVKSGAVKSEDSKVLSALCINWIMPCCVINAFLTEYEPEKLQGLLLAAAAAAVIQAMYILVVRLIGDKTGMSVVERMSSIYSNAGNLIIPLVSALLGDEAVIYCSSFMAVQTFLVWSHCYIKMTGGKVSAKKFFNRNIVATFIGFIIFAARIKLPSMAETVISSVGGTIGPVCMIMTGMIMGGVNVKKALTTKRYYRVCLLRLVVLPVLAVLLMAASGVTRKLPYAGEVLLITTLAAGSPVASVIVQMSDMFMDRDAAADASCVNIMTIIFSMATMPLLVLLYQGICL